MSFITFKCIIHTNLACKILNGYTNLHISCSTWVIVLADFDNYAVLTISSQRRRRAFEKQLPEVTSPSQVEEQGDIEVPVVVADDDGFSDRVDEPLAGKILDPVATPCVVETTVPGKD